MPDDNQADDVGNNNKGENDMKFTITIDDEDRDQQGGEVWPFTLWLHNGPEGDEFEGFTGTGGAIIGDDIPTMLREAADQWPYAEQARQSTARDLRHLLFAVEDQSMTVNDLRRLLFDEEQDAPLTATDVRRVTRTR